MLLVAAVDDSDDVDEVVSAATVLAGELRTAEHLEPAVVEGLVRLSPSGIAFRHPLVRSSVQHGVRAERARRPLRPRCSGRPAGPARLAPGIGGHRARRVRRCGDGRRRDPGAAARIGAGCPAGPRTSRRTERYRGGTRATTAPAAELAAQSGRSAQSRGYLDRSRSLLADPHDRLLWEAVDELTDESMHGGAVRVDALVGLAEQARTRGDEDLALRFLLRAAMRCWHLDFGADVERRVVAATELGRRSTEHDPRRLVIYAYASPFERAADVVGILAERAPSRDDDPGQLLMYGYAGACTGGLPRGRVYCRAAAESLREQDRLTMLVEALSLLAWCALRRSRWHVALPAAEECVRIAGEIGQPVPEAAGLAALAAIGGVQGDDEAAEALAVRAEALATATRNTIGLAVTHLARGLTAGRSGAPGGGLRAVLAPLCAA